MIVCVFVCMCMCVCVCVCVSQSPHDIWYTQCPAVRLTGIVAARPQPVVVQSPYCYIHCHNENNATLAYDNGVHHDK